MSQMMKKCDPAIVKIEIEDHKIKAEINDGRIVLIPISWFPRLAAASSVQLHNFSISPSGYGVSWPELDEDISVKSFVS